jgi:cell division septation protein DedD
LAHHQNMLEQGAVRNLEQIQEQDDRPKMPRWVTGAFLVLGGACIAFAAMALSGRKTTSQPPKADPLGDLLAQHAKSGTGPASAKPTDLGAQDVTFPTILSDQQSPTTALAAVKGPLSQRPAASATATAPVTVMNVAPTAPPPPADRLPVVPLPAQHVLEATPVITRPRDGLTKAASDAAQINTTSTTNMAPSGREGGYQLQVSSFRTQAEANQFSDQLRARGHKAYVVEAHVPGRGTWHRVRIGPFSSQHAAAQYRSSFEAKEHVVPFIVPPSSK